MLPKYIEGATLNKITKYSQLTFFSLAILYFGKALFIPMMFGLLIALIGYPVSSRLEKKGWRRSWAIALVVCVVAALFSILLWLLTYELNIIIKDIPRISEKVHDQAPAIQDWFKENLGIDAQTTSGWFRKIINDLQNSLTGSFRVFLNGTFSAILSLVMIPVYASLFLYNRGTFIRYLETVAGNSSPGLLQQILHKSIDTYFHFVKGTFFVYLIVGALNSIGLLMLGIQHAILYGMITAFMTIIPYIGIVISAAIPVTIAFITKDSLWYPLGVILIFTAVQYAEANIIFPRIVGAQLNLSTWSTLVAMIAGSVLWGVAGMILFIPLLGILKIVSDHIEGLKSLNILLNRKEGYTFGNPPAVRDH